MSTSKVTNKAVMHNALSTGELSQATDEPVMRLMSGSVPLVQLLSPLYMFASLWEKRGLVLQFAQREVLSRNRGSSLGMLWMFLQPLLMLSVYTFVFSVVWKAKWGSGESESNAVFATSVLCGLIVFDIFAGPVGVAPSLIINNANYVKKVIFPLELLPLAQLFATLLIACVSITIMLVGNAFFGTGVHASMLWLPVVLLPVVLFAAGVAWLVSSLGVFLRDLKQLVSGLLLPVLFFLTPVFYPASRVPQQFEWVLHINPLAAMVENARAVSLVGVGPNITTLTISYVISYVTMQAGFAFFMKSKRGFADVA